MSRSPRQRWGAALMVSACLAGAGDLNAATFQGLGDLGGGDSKAWSVSANGGTVVGESTVAGTGSTSSRTRGFIWTAGAGMEDLGFFADGSGQFRALDVSGDGSTAVGRGSLTAGGREAFSGAKGTLIRLGDLIEGNTLSTASAISDNGRVIVGSGTIPTGLLPVVWVDGAATPTALTVPSNTTGTLLGISGDGMVGAGWLSDGGGQRAQRWTMAGGFTDLGTLNSNSLGLSEGHGVSADGATIVGFADSALGVQAFAWTGGGGMVGLGDLAGGPFESTARAASGDGSVIVGYGTTLDTAGAAVHEAFIWDAKNGMRKLQDVLTNLGVNSDGWRLSEAHGISADGNTIVGFGINPRGQTEAFMATLVTLVPEPGTAGALLALCGVILMRRPGRTSRMVQPRR